MKVDQLEVWIPLAFTGVDGHLPVPQSLLFLLNIGLFCEYPFNESPLNEVSLGL